MRFTTVSSIAVAMLASDAVAWSTHRSYSNRHGGWRWNWPSSSDAVAEPVTTAVAGGVVTEVVTEIVAPTVHTTVQTSVKKTSTAAAAPVATGGSSSSLDSDQQACLDAHNKARSDVGTNALVWDDDLAAGAQEWANNLASTGSFEHSGADGVGENLYMQSNSDSPFLNAANAWISEKSSYNGEVIDSSNYMNFGHYTQIVWKSTTKVGVAVAKGSSGSYVVARYSPPGNYIGEKPY